MSNMNKLTSFVLSASLSGAASATIERGHLKNADDASPVFVLATYPADAKQEDSKVVFWVLQAPDTPTAFRVVLQQVGSGQHISVYSSAYPAEAAETVEQSLQAIIPEVVDRVNELFAAWAAAEAHAPEDNTPDDGGTVH